MPAMANTQLDEANAKFTYKGKPIHPFLVGKFYNWMSDRRPPIVTTVDVAASFDTNEYRQKDIEKRGNWWFAEKKETYNKDTINHDIYGYHWLGRLANGCHVVEMGWGGGGSGFFEDLMVITFSEGTIMRDGEKDNQLLMTVIETQSLGDRYEGDIKVYPDKVIIPPSKDQRGGGSLNKVVELRFPVKR
jgi:hypothetical protein